MNDMVCEWCVEGWFQRAAAAAAGGGAAGTCLTLPPPPPPPPRHLAISDGAQILRDFYNS